MVAMPLASVRDVGAPTLAPAPVVAHDTVVPTCGVPLNVTNTRSGFGSAAVTGPVCASPLAVAVFAMSGTGAAVAVAVKETGEPEAPASVAVAVC